MIKKETGMKNETQISSLDEPFFVVGCERSGTTMLRLMLNEHSRLRIPRESNFIPALMDQLPLDSPLDADQKKLACQIISQERQWQKWEISETELYQQCLALEQPYLSELVATVFSQLGNPRSKMRWGDKTPAYIEEIDRLHQLFPNAKFIHIIRDARDVCHSLRKTNWVGSMTEGRAQYWSEMLGKGIGAGRKLPVSLYLEVKYEDLVLQTEASLKQICTFLGEEYEPSMLEFYRQSAAEEGSQAILKHHTKLLRGPQSTDVNRWQTEISKTEVAIIEAFAGDQMDEVGQIRFFRGSLRPLVFVIRVIFDVLSMTRPLRRRMKIHIPAKFWKSLGAG
jgi:hypothetical protein